MEFGSLGIYYLSAGAGLIMVIGGIWLIATEKIRFDQETGHATQIKTAVGTFQTNAPALVLFIIGFLFLIYPLWKITPPELKEVKIKGPVRAGTYPILVYGLAVRHQDSLQNEGEFTLHVPVLRDQEDYKIFLVVNDHIVDEKSADLKKANSGELVVEFRPVEIEKSTFQPSEIKPLPPEFK